MKKSKNQLGKRIQKLRKEKLRVSQEKFAEMLNISRTHLGHLEQNRKQPSIGLLRRIARKLGVEPRDLI